MVFKAAKTFLRDFGRPRVGSKKHGQAKLVSPYPLLNLGGLSGEQIIANYIFIIYIFIIYLNSFKTPSISFYNRNIIPNNFFNNNFSPDLIYTY